jgi:hypothetical protein
MHNAALIGGFFIVRLMNQAELPILNQGNLRAA